MLCRRASRSGRAASWACTSWKSSWRRRASWTPTAASSNGCTDIFTVPRWHIGFSRCTDAVLAARRRCDANDRLAPRRCRDAHPSVDNGGSGGGGGRILIGRKPLRVLHITGAASLQLSTYRPDGAAACSDDGVAAQASVIALEYAACA